MVGYTYPDSWGDSFVGMAYALRASRDSVVASISESDLLDHRTMVVNPLIGEIPSQEEILEELERGVLPKEMMVDDALCLAKAFQCKPEELFQ